MTFADVNKKMQDAQRQTATDQQAIVAFARNIVHTLRDAGREHSAKELERLLWELDAHAQEHSKWISDHLDEVMPALLAALKKEGDR